MIKIVNILKSTDYITAFELSKNLNISIRTVKNRIKDINLKYKNLILSSNKGYSLNFDLQNKINIIDNKSVYENPSKRKNQLINILLESSNENINFYDLIDKFFISESTLKNDLKQIQTLVNKYHIELIQKNESIRLKGNESDIRRLQSFLIYQNSNINFLSADYIQNTFPNINISLIKDIINYAITNNKFIINDFAMNNLVLHLAIIIKRITKGEFIQNNTIKIDKLDENCLNVSKDIINSVEFYFKIKIPKNEIIDFTLILISRLNKMDYLNLSNKSLNNIINKKHLKIIENISTIIKNNYHIDLNDEEFYIRFCLHINNLIIRSKTGHSIKNPMTTIIKSSAPLIYEIAVTIASILKKELSIDINEDEIAYIAFHIGSTIEEKYSKENKIRTIICCPDYYNINNNLMSLINEKFNNDLFIIDIINDLYIENYDNIDLIISTLPLNKIYSQPFIQISPFNNLLNYTKIKNAIDLIKGEKLKLEFKKNLEKIFDKELFIKINKKLNLKTTINLMTDLLENKNYVNKEYRKRVFEREKLSSTAFENFAIPHPVDFNSSKTFFCILLSNNNIDWNGKNVRLVIMMSFNKDERAIFNSIFEPITEILLNSNNFQKLLNSKNYEEFINILVDSI